MTAALLFVVMTIALIAMGRFGFGNSWGKAIGDAFSGRPHDPFSH